MRVYQLLRAPHSRLAGAWIALHLRTRAPKDVPRCAKTIKSCEFRRERLGRLGPPVPDKDQKEVGS
jgi:hypothetical protein